MSFFLRFLRRVRQGMSCVSAWEARTPTHLANGLESCPASKPGASPRRRSLHQAHSEGLFCHVSFWLLTIAIRSECKGSCKLHASLQQSGLRKSCAAHTPGAPGRLEHQGEGAGLDSSSPCRRFCASVDHRSELCQLRTCTCVCFQILHAHIA